MSRSTKKEWAAFGEGFVSEPAPKAKAKPKLVAKTAEKSPRRTSVTTDESEGPLLDKRYYPWKCPTCQTWVREEMSIRCEGCRKTFGKKKSKA